LKKKEKKYTTHTITVFFSFLTMSGGCPVDHSKWTNQSHPLVNPHTNEELNPVNMMPNIPNEKREPNQRVVLGTERERSSIPIADETRDSIDDSTCPGAKGKESVWIYPSEQMFFNALKRKNWNVKEEDMKTIVPIHNAVNERAWKEILEWESLHQTECNQPKLVRFQGKPNQISPKARLRSWFGYTLPFDRHDWVIDRCGKHVTYVIDFYAGKKDPNQPHAIASFYLDVRPALTFSGCIDRIHKFFHDLLKE
jgi:cytochrome c heme-lyase